MISDLELLGVGGLQRRSPNGTDLCRDGKGVTIRGTGDGIDGIGDG